MNNLVIIGASGFGREVAWLVERINKVNPIARIIKIITQIDIPKLAKYTNKFPIKIEENIDGITPVTHVNIYLL